MCGHHYNYPKLSSRSLWAKASGLRMRWNEYLVELLVWICWQEDKKHLCLPHNVCCVEFCLKFSYLFVVVFTLLDYSGISNGPALAQLPTCQHNESSPPQSSHGHWNMMIIYKRFLKSFFAFLDALASLRPIFKIDWFGHVFEIASIEFSLVPDCFNNQKSTLSTMSAL